MRKALWFIPVLFLFVAIVAPCARADSVTFTCVPTYVLCTDAAPTAPDVTFPSPMLDITWDSPSSNISMPALPSGWLDTNSYSWIESNMYFIIYDLSLPGIPEVGSSSQFITSDTPVPDQGGTLVFTPATASTPEPGTVTLMLLGIGLVLVMRKRIGLCHSQGT